MRASGSLAEGGFWERRRVLVTGHTGFKGAWLALLLEALGAEVHGFSAPPPSDPSLYALARVHERMSEHRGDIRSREELAGAIAQAKPDVVFHLAAQPLVRRSYEQPAETFEANVLGTLNVIAAAQRQGGVRALICVTSDKCYAPPERGALQAGFAGHREEDPLGGEDPYSASKAAAELIVRGYRAALRAQGSPLRIASARAGNVIGGGDFGSERLVPDVMRAALAGEPVALRNPRAIRPWQHVLCPLTGYLLLARRLHEEERFEGAWNFGPERAEALPVRELVARIAALWPGGIEVGEDSACGPAESQLLLLDSGRAKDALGWRPPLSLTQGLQATVDWYRALQEGEDMRERTLAQLQHVLSGRCRGPAR
ncbi:MAG TPA: CDP-glucose 4,6-dehydratase [Solirubrobacteraceae bacterium]|nr:CDP-glucose 4,6-dehydratase [Solirubrobacteraceae bacterium]